METGQVFKPIGETRKDIENAYDTGEISAKRQAGSSALAEANTFTEGMSRFGGEGFDTGASKKAYAETFANLDANISNIIMSYAVSKNNALMSSDQFLQNMSAQGIIDPVTGNFLRSQYSMKIDMMDKEFNQNVQLMKIKSEAQGQSDLMGGLGKLAGIGISAYLNPIAGVASLVKATTDSGADYTPRGIA